MGRRGVDGGIFWEVLEMDLEMDGVFLGME
jgi:hypothetical protein